MLEEHKVCVQRMFQLFMRIWKSCCNIDMSHSIFGTVMNLGRNQEGMEEGGFWQKGGYRACT
jgi:hypothetical protein